MDDLTPADDETDETDPLLEGFAERLGKLLLARNMPLERQTHVTVGKMFGVGPKAVEKWLKAKGWPRNPTMVGLANWLGVTIDYLITGRPPMRPGDGFGSGPISHVATVMQSMQPEQQYLAARLVDTVAQQPEPDGGGHPSNDKNGTHGR